MRKPAKCRSCNLNYSLTGKAGKHYIVDAEIFCPLCKVAGKSILHGPDEYLCGDTLECNICHNYILYTDNGGFNIWKDEIYLPEDYCLIRSVENCETILLIKEETAFVVPAIIQFDSGEALLQKLKILVLFS